MKMLRWFDHLAINSYWLGINIASGILTPILMPALVVMFMPAEMKNTYLATVRVIGLSVAMLFQPLAGMLSDRSTARMGRRRPFIIWGAILNVIFLFIIGASPSFLGADSDANLKLMLGITTAYGVLLIGTILLQFSSNLGQAAVQGLMPDVVPENQRGRSSGYKSLLELLPAALVALFIGGMVDRGLIWPVIGIIMAGFVITMLITVIFVKEEPLKQKPTGKVLEPILRIIALTAIFVGVTRGAIWLVSSSGRLLTAAGVSINTQIILVGLAGLIAMAGSIFLGVYFGAQVGIGKDARQHMSFIWWVINRLLFLAAVGSIQGFALYFLRDVMHDPKPATTTSILMAAVAVFLMLAAVIGGYVADRVGKKRLVALAAVIAAVGAVLLIFSRNLPMLLVSGAFIGLGTGLFFAANWALGTKLVPPAEAGKYLGISNLAGAGAGIVGAGIGGPMADFFNNLQPGLGYLVIFAIYAGLFLLSILTLVKIKEPSEN
ncbi:MAG: MFS transporter [Anaerolineaceae bacterium]